MSSGRSTAPGTCVHGTTSNVTIRPSAGSRSMSVSADIPVAVPISITTRG